MSTWISKAQPSAAFLIMLAGLAACQPVPGLGTRGTTLAPEIALLGDSFTVRGPARYCPDPGTARETGDAASVVLGRCTETADAPPAILTVTVGPAGSASVMAAGGPALVAFFTSPAGRGTLSARGRAADIRVAKALERDGALFLRLADRGGVPYWRGMAAMAGRLVTISARGNDLPDASAFDLVRDAIKAVRRANPGR